MAADPLTQLKQAADLTQAMLETAQQEKWSVLPEMHQKRAVLFEQIFPLSEAGQTDECRAILQTMIENNQQLEQICREAQQALQVELSGLNKNRKAVAAYQSS